MTPNFRNFISRAVLLITFNIFFGLSTVFSLTVTHAIAPPICPNTGLIMVDVTSATLPYTVTLQYGLMAPFYASPQLSSLQTTVISNIVPGEYYLEVTDASGGPSYTAAFKIDDKTAFPIVPYNDKEAYGVDIKTDVNSNVFATGFFNGNLQFTGQQVLSSGAGYNVYVSKMDSCGNVLWDIQIGQSIGSSCTVNSLCIDNSLNGLGNESVTICGQFQGTIHFPLSPLFPTTPALSFTSGSTNQAFIARFQADGTFQWAVPIVSLTPPNSPGNISAKGVTADDQGHVIVIGDFEGDGATFVDFNTSATASATNMGGAGIPYRDNYYVIYSQSGYLLQFDNAALSSPMDDQTGGICCYLEQSNNRTEVYITGMMDDPSTFPTNRNFLGKQFTLTFPVFSFSETTRFLAPVLTLTPQYEEYFGKSVEFLHNQGNGFKSVYFAGTIKNLNNSGSEPFLFFDNLFSIPPLIQSLTENHIYITIMNVNSNGATALAIRDSSLELYLGGYFNTTGQFPVGGIFNPASGIQDFWVTKSVIQSSSLGCNVTNQWFPPLTTTSQGSVYSLPNYSIPIPEFFGICVDEKLPYVTFGVGKTYITGAYNPKLTSNQLVPWITFPQSHGGPTCYIARIIDDFYQQYPWIKNASNTNSASANLKECEMTIYPNPILDVANLELSCNLTQIVKLSIHSIDGSCVIAENIASFTNGTLKLDISKLRPGVYFVKISDNTMSITKKLVKI